LLLIDLKRRAEASRKKAKAQGTLRSILTTSGCFFSSFLPLVSFFADLIGLDAFDITLSPRLIARPGRRNSTGRT
jgi:hypothetical protein